MNFSFRNKCILIFLLLLLNVVMRFQPENREIGDDSFIIHIMINSLSEFGWAKWILNPLSFIGLYPYSFTSSTQFLVSGLFLTTRIDMNSVIFLNTLIIGLFSAFTAYLMANALINDDLFKYISAFSFSTLIGIVDYTTWTIGERPFAIIFVPLIIYLLLKWKASSKLKYIILLVIISFFTLSTHHVSYFILPIFMLFLILNICKKFKNNNKYINFKIKELYILIPPIAFFIAFSIPFFLNKFIEKGTRYQPLLFNYFRYIGPLSLISIGGIVYLVYKQKKTFIEWFMILSPISLVPFIYIATYMKWFLPVFLIPLIGVGLINIIKVSNIRKRYLYRVFALYLLISIIFTGYFQFLHNYSESLYNGRNIEDSTYTTGLWSKASMNGSAISNDRYFGQRVFAVSEKPFLIPFTSIDQIYGFIKANVSEYERYPISSENFWFDGYRGPDRGEPLWELVHQMLKSPKELGLKYVVENMKANGLIIWHHQNYKSNLLSYVHKNENLIFDSGNINIWTII